MFAICRMDSAAPLRLVAVDIWPNTSEWGQGKAEELAQQHASKAAGSVFVVLRYHLLEISEVFRCGG